MTATRTKRILSIQPVAERGGSDYCLLRMVRSLAHDGWDCHIALPAASPLAGEFAAAGATLHVVPMRRVTSSGSWLHWAAYLAAWPLSVLRLVRLAGRLDASIIASNSLHSWYGWAAAAVLRRPHVWHAREIVVQSASALRLERWLCRHFATTVVAMSGAIASQLDDRNVIVIHEDPDPQEFQPARAGQFRRSVGIADRVPLVGAAGRIDTWKGFDVLLDAVPAMKAAIPGLVVVVAGAPVQGKEGYAQRWADRAAAMADVHWLGPRTDMPALMADLDLFVLPSTEAEPFGLVLVEALASGVPVVATTGGGPSEILAGCPPTMGRLVQPGDAAALAEAVVDLLPSNQSSTSGRRQRRPLRRGRPADFGPVYGGLIAGAPVSGAPVSGAPVSGAPVSAAPVSGAPVSGAPVSGASASEPPQP